MIEGLGLSLYNYKKILELNCGKIWFALKGKKKVHIFLFHSIFKLLSYSSRKYSKTSIFFPNFSNFKKDPKILLSKFIIH